MKTQGSIGEYLSTGQAAKLLGLSIGTIQNLTKEGLLSAHITPGGHRRILHSSFNQFCKKISLRKYQPTKDEHLVCIMHNQSSENQDLVAISEFPHVKVIFNPLDLFGLQRTNITLFMDARLPWLNETILHKDTDNGIKTQIYLYNCKYLPSIESIKIQPKMKAIDGDINKDLIFGYLLNNSNSLEDESTLELTKHDHQEAPNLSNPSSKRLKNALSMNGKRINKPAKPAVNVTGKPTA